VQTSHIDKQHCYALMLVCNCQPCTSDENKNNKSKLSREKISKVWTEGKVSRGDRWIERDLRFNLPVLVCCSNS
jgi:hypothetical protein